jgi:hypothetical protein
MQQFEQPATCSNSSSPHIGAGPLGTAIDEFYGDNLTTPALAS